MSGRELRTFFTLFAYPRFFLPFDPLQRSELFTHIAPYHDAPHGRPVLIQRRGSVELGIGPVVRCGDHGGYQVLQSCAQGEGEVVYGFLGDAGDFVLGAYGAY